MKKYYFELDKVDSLILTYESETRKRWFSEIPARPKTFLGIRYGIHKAIPAGWNNSNDEGKECRIWNRTPSSYYDDYPSYRICDIKKRIYRKAYVEIRFGYKQSFGIDFNSNEEAQKYVDELIASSDKQFHIIINP